MTAEREPVDRRDIHRLQAAVAGTPCRPSERPGTGRGAPREQPPNALRILQLSKGWMMARIRTVKPEMWFHPKVTRVSREARLTFVGLLNQADDAGRCELVPRLLLGAIFPYDHDVGEDEILAWISELSREGLVRPYEHRGRRFLSFPGWDEHQRVDNPSKPRCPDPDDEDSKPLTSEYVDPRESLDRPSRESRGRNVGAWERRSVGASERESGAADAPQDTPYEPPPPDPPKSTKPAKRDELFEAVTDACGWDRSQLTKSARGNANKATGEIRAVGATPQDVHGRAREHRQRWPGCDVTPTSLAKNWSQLGTARPVNGARDGPAMAARYAQAKQEALRREEAS